jgi:hypothetical protein
VPDGAMRSSCSGFMRFLRYGSRSAGALRQVYPASAAIVTTTKLRCTRIVDESWVQARCGSGARSTGSRSV